MEIKRVRKPTSKEKKEILPLMVVVAVITAIITTLIYMTEFHRFDVIESMRLAQNFWTGKSIATHNLFVQLFEFIYGRDYMLNKLEALPISLGISVVFEAFCGVVYKGYTYFHGDNKTI